MVLDDRIVGTKIYRKFRSGVFYEELYRKYQITENDLLNILNRNNGLDYRKTDISRSITLEAS